MAAQAPQGEQSERPGQGAAEGDGVPSVQAQRPRENVHEFIQQHGQQGTVVKRERIGLDQLGKVIGVRAHGREKLELIKQQRE